MRIEWVDAGREPERALALYRSAFEALAPADASYFVSPGWVEPWLLAMAPRERPRLVRLSDGGRPVGAAFVAARRIQNSLLVGRGRFLNATGIRHIDEVSIEGNAFLGAALTRLDDLIRLLDDDWDQLVLPGLSPDHFPGNALDRPPPGFNVVIDHRAPSPFVDLAQVRASGKGYPALLGSNTRSQLKRARTLYQEQGPLTVEVASDEKQALDIYHELKTLHAARWQRDGEPGAFAHPWFDAFHRRLVAERLPHGEIQLLRVRAGDVTVGCLYNFVFRGRVSFYQSGLRQEEDNRRKPGYVCHAAAVEHNAAAGHAIYDFLAGDKQYKHSLATGKAELVWARLERSSWRVAVETSLRQLKRRLSQRA